MKVDELIKMLEKAGWRFERMGKGNCRMYRHPERRNPIAVHYHKGAEVGKGIANKIMKEAGIK